jgi:hypothetical protein
MPQAVADGLETVPARGQEEIDSETVSEAVEGE